MTPQYPSTTFAVILPTAARVADVYSAPVLLPVAIAPPFGVKTGVMLPVMSLTSSRATWPTAREWHTGYNDNFNEEENT